MTNRIRTRRAFLQTGMGLLAAAPTVPTFLDRTMMALAAENDGRRTQAPSGKDGKVLVVVQLSGGNDGLNTVIPFADDAYHRARPKIGVAKNNVVRLDDHFGLNPGLAALKPLFDQG